MEMMISGVTTKDGKTLAHILFVEKMADGKERTAEGTIPDCVITKQNGFDQEEICQLENYLRANLSSLKKEAAKINPLSALMK